MDLDLEFSTNGRFLNPWSDGAWTISNVHFPLHEINEVANDKQYRYLYDYEVFVYERMTKNWFGGMKKEYDLLLLFGGKISKNPTGSGTDSTDFLVSSDEVEKHIRHYQCCILP